MTVKKATVFAPGIVVELVDTAPPVVVPPVIPVLVNGGFEVPVMGAAFKTQPAGATWAFTGSAGISGRITDSSIPNFTSGNPPAPEGVQVAYMQNAGSRIEQSIAFAAGQYALSFKAARRGNNQLGIQTVAVQVDGVEVGRFQPPNTNFTAFTTPPFTVATGSRKIGLVGVGSGGTDFTALVDDVKIVPFAAPAYVAPTFNLPASLALTVGVAVALGQYVNSPLPLTWTAQDTAQIALTPAGMLTAKVEGSAQISVEVDDGYQP